MVSIAPVSNAQNGLMYQTDKVKLKIGEKLLDTGTLYVTADALKWQPDNGHDGIAISWKEVSVLGTSTQPRRCAYVLLNQKLCWRGVYEPDEPNGHNDVPMEQPGGAGGGDAEDDEDEGNVSDEGEDAPEITEFWFMPEDLNTVDTIVQCMSDCLALHPDPADSISEESDFMDNDDDDDEEYDEDARGRMLNLNLN